MPLKEIDSKVAKQIIKKATEKDYKERYATCAEFRVAIDNPESHFAWKPLVGALGLIVIVAIAGYFVFSNIGNTDNQSNVELVINQDSIDYEKANLLIQSDVRDSLKLGLEKMTILAEGGYGDAVQQLVTTYAWIPNEIESNRRKAVLGIEMDSQTKQPMSVDVNRNAFEWLNKAITLSDSSDYKCMYWQSFYYLNGLYVNSDMNIAKRLLYKSKDEAVRAGDNEFLDKINETIDNIYQYEKSIK
jgi:hypothetical protein